MISIEDCIAMSGLDRDEVDAIIEISPAYAR